MLKRASRPAAFRASVVLGPADKDQVLGLRRPPGVPDNDTVESQLRRQERLGDRHPHDLGDVAGLPGARRDGASLEPATGCRKQALRQGVGWNVRHDPAGAEHLAGRRLHPHDPPSVGHTRRSLRSQTDLTAVRSDLPGERFGQGRGTGRQDRDPLPQPLEADGGLQRRTFVGAPQQQIPETRLQRLPTRGAQTMLLQRIVERCGGGLPQLPDRVAWRCGRPRQAERTPPPQPRTPTPGRERWEAPCQPIPVARQHGQIGEQGMPPSLVVGKFSMNLRPPAIHRQRQTQPMPRQRHLNRRVTGGRRQVESEPFAQPGYCPLGANAGNQTDAEIVPVPVLQDANARPAHSQRPLQEQHASTGFGQQARGGQPANSTPDNHDIPAASGSIARRLVRRSLRPGGRRQVRRRDARATLRCRRGLVARGSRLLARLLGFRPHSRPRMASRIGVPRNP